MLAFALIGFAIGLAVGAMATAAVLRVGLRELIRDNGGLTDT